MFFKKNKELKIHAKKIFGSVVKNAYIVAEKHYGEDSAYVREKIALSKAHIGLNSKPDGIDFGGETIWIEFTTGKIVEFNSSEWAWIQTADVKNSYEI